MKKTKLNHYLFIYFDPLQEYYRVWTEQVARFQDVLMVPRISQELCPWQQRIYDFLPTGRLEIAWTNIIKRKRLKRALRQALKGADKHLQKCFCFSYHYDYVSLGLTRFVRRCFPNAKLFYEFGDRIAMYYRWYPEFQLASFQKKFDLLSTYNLPEAADYHLPISPVRRLDYSMVVPADCEEVDVFFIGKAKNRLQEILSVADRCQKLGLSIHFMIVGVPEPEIIPIEGVIYNQAISYRRALQYSKRARAILNIFQEGADGITLRDEEAIGMNKILITDGKAIFSSPFYTEEKLIPLDKLEEQVEKIRKKDDSIEWNKPKTYEDQHAYFDWLEAELSK